jgi:hypothetical protein
MLQATSPLPTDFEAVQQKSFNESVHWAIGIVPGQFVVIALIAVIVASLGALCAFMARLAMISLNMGHQAYS